MIGPNKLMLIGGHSQAYDTLGKVYTIDLSTGYKDDRLQDLEKPTWSVMPAFYSNKILHIFHKAEELDDYPYLIKYYLTE